MALKIYYLTSETAPFCGAYSLSQFTRKISMIYNEDPDIDIRLLQPKYGFISERKYVIREVIRLRDLPIRFNDDDVVVNLKSAFIPESRVQVYFLQYNEFFKPLPELLYKARNGRVYKDNDLKFTLFAKVALDALKHLFWAPDIIICNDWQTSMVPALLKQYQDDEFYQNIKTAFLLHDLTEDYRYFSRETYQAVGLDAPDNGAQQDNIKFAMEHAHKVIVVDDEKEGLLKQINKDKNLKGTYENCDNAIVTLNSETVNEDWKSASAAIKSILQEI